MDKNYNKEKLNFQSHVVQSSSISIAITHHLDVGVLSQQAVIGHGLKGEKSSGQTRHSLSLSMLTRQQELVLPSQYTTNKAVCVCVCEFAAIRGSWKTHKNFKWYCYLCLWKVSDLFFLSQTSILNQDVAKTCISFAQRVLHFFSFHTSGCGKPLNADGKHWPAEALLPPQCHSALIPHHLHHCGDDGDDAFSSSSSPSLPSPFSASSSCAWKTSNHFWKIDKEGGDNLLEIQGDWKLNR